MSATPDQSSIEVTPPSTIKRPLLVWVILGLLPAFGDYLARQIRHNANRPNKRPAGRSRARLHTVRLP